MNTPQMNEKDHRHFAIGFNSGGACAFLVMVIFELINGDAISGLIYLIAILLCVYQAFQQFKKLTDLD